MPSRFDTVLDAMEQGINTENVTLVCVHKMGELSMLHYTTVLGKATEWRHEEKGSYLLLFLYCC